MSEPRRYRFGPDWGTVLLYLLDAGFIVYMTVQVMLAIGDGRWP